MAIDPSILTRFRTPDVGGSFRNALLNVQGLQGIQQQPLRNRLLEARAGQAEQAVVAQAEQDRLRSVVQAGAELLPDIRAGNVPALMSKLTQRRTRLQEQGLPTNDTDEALTMLQQPGGLEQLGQVAQQSVQLGQQLGFLEAPGGLAGTASQRDFETFRGLQAKAQAPDATQADIRAANQFGRQAGFTRETAQELSDIKVEEARRKKEGEAEVLLETKPEIEAAVAAAVGEAEAVTPKGKLELSATRQRAALAKSKANIVQKEFKVKASEAKAANQSTIDLIDSLIKHPGRLAATGGTAAFPTRPGSRAADFEADFNRLKGGAFLEAVQQLKGSGQISNSEGEAATAAILGVEVSQSEEGFTESLRSLRSRLVEAGKRRAGTFQEAEAPGDVTGLSNDDLLDF